MESQLELTSWTAGELSPRMKGRVDHAKYFNGAAAMTNVVVLPQGGYTKRPGTMYVANATDQNGPNLLWPFIFATVQAYMLCFSALTIAVFANDGQVLDGASPVLITTTYAAGDLKSLKFAQSADTLFIAGGGYAPSSLTRTSNTAWTFAALALRDGPYLDENTTTTTAAPSFVSGSSWTIAFSSATGINNNAGFTSADIGRHFRIQLYSLWAWGIITAVADATHITIALQPKVNNGASGAIDGAQWTANTLYPTGATVLNNGNYYIASSGGLSAADGSNGPQGLSGPFLDGTIEWRAFGATNASKWQQNVSYVVGDFVNAGGNTYECIQGGSTNSGDSAPTGTGANESDGTCLWTYCLPPVFPTTTLNWQLGLFGGASGWPLTVRFWQERLFFGGLPGQPNTLVGSVTGDFTNFAPTQADGTVTSSNALDWTIDDDQVNAIHALVPAGSAQAMQLGIMTDAAEHILQAATTSQALTATSVQAYQETSYGSAANVSAIRIGKAVLFTDRTGRKIREWAFYWQVNGFIGPDLTQSSEHITRAASGAPASQNGIAQMVYQQAPYQVIWAIRNDGTLLSFTYDRDQQVFAPCQHQLGGNFGLGPPPVVESIAVIPSPDGTYDELWLEVLRTIDGVNVRFVEVMTRYFDGQLLDQAWFVDAALQSTLTYPNATLTIPTAGGFTDQYLPPGNQPRTAAPSYIGTGVLNASASVFSAASVNSIVLVNGGKLAITQYLSPTSVMANVITPMLSLSPAAANAWSCTKLQTGFSGLSYLNGVDVVALGDGAVYPPMLVAAGSVTLAGDGAALATIGLPYTSINLGMPWEPSRAALAVSSGKMKRVDTLWARFLESGGCWYGTRTTDEWTDEITDSLDQIESMHGGDPSDQPPPLYTGIKKLLAKGSTDRETQILIAQSDPLPLTVLSVFARGDVEELPSR